MNPAITKMDHFAMIVNNFYSITIVAKSSILNVGFLDPPLHYNKFAAKAVDWFKPNRLIMYTWILKERSI